MVPDGWRVQPLGSVVQRVSRPVEVKHDDEYTQIGVRSHGRGVFIKEPVSGRELGTKRVFHVEPDCLVLNIVFAWEQAVAKTSPEHRGLIASHRFPMYRPIYDRSDIEFLRYFFLTPRGKHLLGLASPGGAGRNKTLGQKELERLVVALPPLPEQKKIADILSTWDKAIETTEKLLANAEKQKRALMQQLLTGKRRLKGFDGREWKEVKLGRIWKVTTGQPAPNNPDAYCDEGIPFLRVSCLAPLLKGRSEGSFEKVSPKTVDQYRLKLFPAGTIVFAKSGMSAKLGRVYRLEGNAYLVSHLAALLPNPSKADERFLFYYLQMYPPSDLIQGDGFPSIKTSLIAERHVNLPPLPEQIAIADCLDASDKMVANYRTQLFSLSGEKRALTQQLLTGNRRVSV
ncbi:restriction endonuclease subunit S [Ensifer sp. 4252]|uniref:restriction endonuclease subunit S n=1 Tax=Ensifer sp. 4252 TaxID=3373915 RepID=UPI003D236FA0